ncbi:unnamed protein product [Adineta steineri]|uniref:Uncharacterized protein n=1 Tax=Adineta steineri TaxID=433720 RepID=A0A815UML1_9BILA|nr:unnamed protein product [Adineta steineri]CAF3828188.1 unnamed protein product [Adineta steineri]
MVNDNSTDEILSSTGSQAPNIILGCIGIGFCAISICETFTINFTYLNSFGILIQIFLSILQPLPILLTGVYQYEDYHSQMSFTNWRGMILGASLIWLSPISITVIIYACTLNYIRHHSSTFTLLH